MGLIPGSGRSPGEGNGNPLVFLPGKFHGQRSLAGYSLWGHKELDTIEVAKHPCTQSDIAFEMLGISFLSEYVHSEMHMTHKSQRGG